MNTQLLTQAGATAIGQHGQVAIKERVVVERQPITILERLYLHDFGRAAPVDHVLIQCLPQALAEPGVFHDIAKCRNALFERRQAGGAKAPAI
ncbi:hypothetical protein D9M73_207230 [compost metagenome]